MIRRDNKKRLLVGLMFGLLGQQMVMAGALTATIKSPGTRVIHGYSPATLPIASSLQISELNTNIITDIDAAASKIAGAIANNVKAGSTTSRMQAQVGEEVAKGKARGEQAATIEDRYAPESLGYTTCFGKSKANTAIDAGQAEAAASGETQDGLSDHDLSGPTTTGQVKAGFKERVKVTEKGAELLISSGSVTPTDADWDNGTEFIKNTVNPEPDKVLPSEVATGLSKRNYDTLVIHKAEQLSIPEKVLSDIHAGDKATIKADRADIAGLWGQISPGKPFPYANDKGMISSNAYLKLIAVDGLSGNPAWHDYLLTAGTKGVLIEIAKMRSIALKMQYDQLQLTKGMALMMAKDAASKIHQTLDPKIRKLYQSNSRNGLTDISNN